MYSTVGESPVWGRRGPCCGDILTRGFWRTRVYISPRGAAGSHIVHVHSASADTAWGRLINGPQR